MTHGIQSKCHESSHLDGAVSIMLKVMTCIRKESPWASSGTSVAGLLLANRPLGNEADSDPSDVATIGKPAAPEDDRFEADTAPMSPALNAVMTELPLLRESSMPPPGELGSL